jgi:hypothetical protein
MWGDCVTNSTTFPRCMGDLPYPIPLVSLHSRFEVVAMLFPATDILCCFVVIMLIVFLGDRLPVLARHVDGSNVTSADYSVGGVGSSSLQPLSVTRTHSLVAGLCGPRCACAK